MKERKPISLPQKAGMLCHNQEFIEFLETLNWPKDILKYPTNAEWSGAYVRKFCEIASRSELSTNIAAAAKFKKLLDDFEGWKAQHQYADNLARF